MKQLPMVLGGIAILFNLQAQETVISIRSVVIPAPISSSSDDLNTMLEAVEATTPVPASSVPMMGTFHSAQNPLWPPLPGNLNNTPAWDLGDGIWLLDDLEVDYSVRASLFSRGGMHAMDEGPPIPGDGDSGTNSSGGGFAPAISFSTNDLWLQINGATNGVMGWTAYLTIHTPWNDTNLTHDLFCTSSLDSPVDWHFLMRCVSTNVVVSGLCEAQEFFALRPTNGDLTVSTNSTAQQLAQLLVPPWVTVTNATYTGAVVARGTFAGGNGCGLPIDSGVILSSGQITNAIGPNDDDGSMASQYSEGNGSSDLGQQGDADLSSLVGNGSTYDAAVLEFDIISTNSFTLQFQYIFASEEYPEWIGAYNDPMVIFVSTNFDGTNWVNNITNDLALVPGTTNVPVSVNSINGGFIGGDFYSDYLNPVSPTNTQYYVDNHDPNYSAATNAAPAPEFNIQYDGMTVLLTAQTFISANVTKHIKVAIADYNDSSWDSAVFITTQATCP